MESLKAGEELYKRFSGHRSHVARDSFNKDWEKWQTRNLNVAHHLATKLDKPIDEISDLMYNITVQNYSQILNPISGFANKCEVPFASADACTKLLTIFDFEGNLRHPSDPKSLFQLLQLMQHISRWGSNWEKKQSQIEKQMQHGTESIIPELRLPLSCMKKSGKSEIIILNKNRLSLNNNIKDNNNYYINNDNMSTKKLSKKRSHISVVKSIDKHNNLKPHSKSIFGVKKAYKSSKVEVNTSKAKKGARYSLFNMQEILLMDDNGRRRGLGTIDLAILKSKQKYFLRLLLEKNMKDNPDQLLNALIEADLGDPLKETKPDNAAAAEISNFYSAVVSKPERFANVHWQVPKLYQFKKENMPFSDRVLLLYHEPWKVAESMSGIHWNRYYDLLRSHEIRHRTEHLN
ncbi:uncharacterized protein LOC116803977 [Drosophila mojavensis]|uniref:uncharacterized protein LOC116803977 n=1 Tax=Drosophila mojavensis TaxID=7230 RepID=UPI0013EECFF6|nr:uncharacterized protein LOC116803977 [Drosophila mojavensis]